MEETLHPLFKKLLGRTDDWPETNPNVSSLDYNFLTRHPTMSRVFLCVMGFAVIAGTLGNILIIGSVKSYRKLRTNTGSTVVLNLAVADLFITAIVGPFHIISVVRGPRFYMGKELFCQVLGSFCTTSCVVSMNFIAAVAVNRYMCICRPSWYKSIFTDRKTVIYCCGLWLYGFSIDLPNWLGWSDHTFNLKEMLCSFDHEMGRSYPIFLTTVALGVPIILVFFCYIAVYRFVNNAHAALQKFYKENEQAAKNGSKITNILPVKREDMQLAVTLFLTFLTFLVMWLPYMTAVAVDHEYSWPKQVYVITVTMGHSNSFLNSIIYGVSNPMFRRGYSVFLHKLLCCNVEKGQSKARYRESTAITLNSM